MRIAYTFNSSRQAPSKEIKNKKTNAEEARWFEAGFCGKGENLKGDAN